jgi:hypothetical protein
MLTTLGPGHVMVTETATETERGKRVRTQDMVACHKEENRRRQAGDCDIHCG